MASESGYSNQKKLGISQFKTIQHLGGGKHGSAQSPKSLYEIAPSKAITSISDILGKNGQTEFWNIELTAHASVVGNVLRFTTGVAKDWEFEVMQVIDVNNVYILPISDKPSAADEATVMGWITNKVSSQGESSVSISSAPTQYKYDGVDQTVIQDTVTPVNNRALPSLNFMILDGVQIPISKDTGSPANTVALPVEITGASGPINITAGDINVQTTAEGANFDSMRIGDGTAKYAGITAANEIKSHDEDAKTALASLLAELQLKADLTETQPVSIASLPIATGAATEAKQDSEILAIGLLAKLTDTQPVSVASLPLPTGAATEATLASVLVDTTAIKGKDFATETTLAALSAKLPATLGQKASAASLAAVLSTEQELILGAIKTAVESSAAATNTGAITNAQVAVGLSAVRATVSGSAPNAARKKLLIKPSKNNTGSIYLGSSSVTIANGLEIIGPDRLEFLLDASDYYLISDLAAQVCEIIEVI